MKIITIIGARPQIIKAAALSRAISTSFSNKITELIVHTGQHYDQNMSEVFFEELGIPKPTINLNIGSGSHGKQTALMIEEIEKILIKEQPKALIVYGDTNSTLAGTIAASKIHIPIIHIEAGLRSFNKRMPEEINRLATDAICNYAFVSEPSGLEYLLKESFPKENIFSVGNTMIDSQHYGLEVAIEKAINAGVDILMFSNNFS